MARFDVIYTPKGPAKEYSAWACNIVKSGQRGDGPKSCSHGCLYCYNPPGTADGPVLKDNILERLKADLKKLKGIIKPNERVEFTFVGDLYDPALPDYVAVNCLRACKEAGIPFQVLTKNGKNARADFGLYGPDDLFGVTLTCCNDSDSLKWEPGASLWSDRIEALKEAHIRGIKTWVSFEPVIDPKQTLRLIELVAPFADKIKVGKMNSKGNQTWHGEEIKHICQNTDWSTFGTEAIDLLKQLGKDFYIKDDLKKFLPIETPKNVSLALERDSTGGGHTKNYQMCAGVPGVVKGNALSFCDVLGVPLSEVPVCLLETWDSAPLMEPNEARTAIILFAMSMRDRLISKDAAKKAISGWSGNGILADSEVDRAYDSEERLTCAYMLSCKPIAANCEKSFCDYPNQAKDNRAWHGAQGIKIEDICEISQKADGNQSVKFSPDKAAATIVKQYSIVSTPDERIWIYQDGIYRQDGEMFIDQILDKLAGDLYNSRAASETHRKIVLRTLKDYSVFDANPYLFCIENGVVDMQTGRFLKHDPGLYLTMKSPIRFDSSATCPEIEKFLGSALGSAENVLSFLDVMTAKTTDLLFEYFVAMIGGGSNGKTIAEELIRAFFGDETISEVDLLTLTQNRFDRRELFKKKFLINSEVSGDVKESRWIKYISGGGRIDADQKGKDHIQFRPRCLIIFDTNNPPKFADSSYAFQRRLVKIDFQNTFVDEPKEDNERQRDPFILQKITNQKELSGLLNLLILRARDVLPEKKIYRRATGAMLADEYRMQADSVTEFFEMFTELDPGLWTQKTELYSKYKEFCEKINAVPRSTTVFNRYATKNLRLEEKRQSVQDAGFVRGFWGIGIDHTEFEKFCRENTEDLPSKSIALPGFPTLPSLKRIVDRIVYREKVGGDRKQKNRVNPVNPGTDSDFLGKNGGIGSEKSVKDELEEINLRRKEHEEHFKTPEPRNLDEKGEWEDCEKCGLPLPLSWQNKRGGCVYCPDCIKLPGDM